MDATRRTGGMCLVPIPPRQEETATQLPRPYGSLLYLRASLAYGYAAVLVAIAGVIVLSALPAVGTWQHDHDRM
ncbi:MAG: hypothetical protein ACYCST_11335 [Acidimicrobiales bacterium]